MDPKNDLVDETVIPISKAVIGAFAKSPNILYANHENGSLYISNGFIILKTSQAEFDDLLEQVNKRRGEAVAPVEKTGILKYIDSDKGKFELTGEPLEFEISDNQFMSLFADEKQYFGYNKKYVDIFNNGDNRLFVDDNATYSPNSHSMIVKSRADEILGVVLPLRLPEEIYGKLADVLPLKIKWKTEYERIKENLTNDPYIGKEFFDGRDNHIISEVKEVNGADVYVVPNVADGKISGYAAHVKVDEIEKQVALWEANRVSRENDKPAPPVEKESPHAREESKPPARPFTYLQKSPWGEVTASEKLCPGVFAVSTDKQGGIMVTRDMTAAFSPAAVKCGVKFKDFLCFEDNGAKDVALRELLDKKLCAVPGGTEENINKSLRERQPGYWRSRENGRVHLPSEKTAPVHDRYEYAKSFFEEAYKQAVQEIGGEQFILSAVMHADEKNKALSEKLGRDVYHYHLHVVYVPVVPKELYFKKNNKNPELAGKLKEVINQISHSKKWPLKMSIEKNGKSIFVNSYSLLQDRFYEHMIAAGFIGFERGERGSTAEHLSDTEYKTQQEKVRLAETAAEVEQKQKAAAALDKTIENKTQSVADLDERAEKKKKRIEKLDETLTVKTKAAATVAEVEAMGKPGLLGGFSVSADEMKTLKTLAKKSVTADEKVAAANRRVRDADTELAEIKTKLAAEIKKRPSINDNLSWWGKFTAAMTRAPKRLMAVIEEILRQPPERQEPEKQTPSQNQQRRKSIGEER